MELHRLPPRRNRNGNLANYPPSNWYGTSSTTPPPRNRNGNLANYPPPPRIDGTSSTTPPSKSERKPRQLANYPPPSKNFGNWPLWQFLISRPASLIPCQGVFGIVTLGKLLTCHKEGILWPSCGCKWHTDEDILFHISMSCPLIGRILLWL